MRDPLTPKGWLSVLMLRALANIERRESVASSAQPEQSYTEPTSDRWANLTHWVVVAPLRGAECVPRVFDEGTEVTTAEEAVQRALAGMAVDWEDGGAVKEGLEILVFERGSESARFVLGIDAIRIPPLATPDWSPR